MDKGPIFGDSVVQLNITMPPREQIALWGKNLFQHPQTPILIKQLGKKYFLITDPSLAKRFSLWIESLQLSLGEPLHLILIPFSENIKNQDTLSQVEKAIFEQGVSRESVILALGGGVIHDVVGLAASIILRGIPFVMIPTTLLAMADACFGGKTAINCQQMKNAIGSFYPAHRLLIDEVFIESLPKFAILEGMAEIIKCALIHDLSLFDEIEKKWGDIGLPSSSILLRWAKKAAEIKMKFVLLDPLDQNERMALNFAHTFAHALEIFSQHTITHGLAVLWGIYFESALSWGKGSLSTDDLERIQRLLGQFIDLKKPPCTIDTEEEGSSFLKLMMKDKKAKKLPHFVFLKEIGQIQYNGDESTHPVSLEEIKHVMELLSWAKV